MVTILPEKTSQCPRQLPAGHAVAETKNPALDALPWPPRMTLATELCSRVKQIATTPC